MEPAIRAKGWRRNFDFFIKLKVVRLNRDHHGLIRRHAPARERLAAAALAAELHVLVGEAASTISSFADSQGCSLILIGTRGHSGLAGTLLGSVATKLVHLAKVPVLLLRAGA